MGSSISSIGTKIAVAKGVFTGMKAAYVAFKAGATASQAASAGANALIVGLDPTSIAVSLAINFMMEFLFAGCDQQDMETAMLRSSGMCHEIGSYCTSSFLGVCLQQARGHCCFNTKLGRIIQEQGRPQLKAFNGNLWGTAKKPMCRGFTPEEFQALDFSKMDLSEYYADIEARAQSEIQIDMGGAHRCVSQSGQSIAPAWACCWAWRRPRSRRASRVTPLAALRGSPPRTKAKRA